MSGITRRVVTEFRSYVRVPRNVAWFESDARRLSMSPFAKIEMVDDMLARGLIDAGQARDLLKRRT